MKKQRISAPLLLILSILMLASLACGLMPTIRPIDSGPAEPQISIQDAVATAMAVEFVENEVETIIEVIPPDLDEGTVDRRTAVTHSLDLESNLIWVYEEVNPSVVQILVLPSENASELSALGSGSGFVYDEQGHIVTNNHVIEGAPTLLIIFADGTRRRGEIIGQDVDSDLAVVKVSSLPDGVKPVPLGDSSQIQVGQLVVAIGSPFGESGSMTLGIISGLGRSMPSQRVLEFGGRYSLPQVIQTDAPINPGNSGGPLLNLQGEVVGVNAAIRTTTGFNSGVGFAIPVNAVHRIAPALIANGSYTYPFMGVTIRPLTLNEVEEYGMQGACVVAVGSGSPAAQSGLLTGTQTSCRNGDVIVAIDDTTIRNADDLISHLVFETEVGQTVELSVLRNGRTLSVPLTLGEWP